MMKITSYKKIIPLSLIAAAVMMSVYSCNKQFPNTLVDEFKGDSMELNLGTRKVLLVIIDGAVGAEVKKLAPRNLTLMSDFAIYSYDALMEYQSAEPMPAERGYADIMTGVYASKHGVIDDDFANNNLAQYPSFLTRLKEKHPNWKTAAFGTSGKLINELARDAGQKEQVANDEAVKSAVVNALNTDDDMVMITAQFSGVDVAGKSGSYSSSDAGYKNAILKTDDYIGDMLAAMRARKQFKNENWLVIVTSSKGSDIASDPDGAARNAYNDSRRNSLFFVYNPRFNSQTALKPGAIIPYLGTSPLYNGNQENSKAQVIDDNGMFDFGNEGSFTIQCKVKFKPGEYYYPAFLGKRASFDGGVTGWVMFLEADYWMINFGQTGQGNTQVKGQTIADNRWHTLTAVIKQEGANRMVYTYTDGVYSGNSANIAGKGNLNTSSLLTVGYIPGSRFGGGYSPVDYYVTDIRIYNEALTSEYIAQNYCKISVPETDPYHNNLLGYWPANSVTGSKELIDYSGNDNPLVVNQLNAVSFNDATNQICPDISEEVYRTVPNSVDVANQIYQWFGILIDRNWKLDGKSWIPSYNDLNE